MCHQKLQIDFVVVIGYLLIFPIHFSEALFGNVCHFPFWLLFCVRSTLHSALSAVHMKKSFYPYPVAFGPVYSMLAWFFIRFYFYFFSITSSSSSSLSLMFFSATYKPLYYIIIIIVAWDLLASAIIIILPQRSPT